MSYESIFDFLNSDERFKHVHNMCISMEKEIISNSYNVSLFISRVASELVIKLLIDDSDYRMDFFQKTNKGILKTRKNGDYKYISLSEMIEKCREHQIIGKKVEERYNYLKNVGNSNAHGDRLIDFGLKDCEKAHNNLFLIALHGYNKLTNENKHLKYENHLGDYDFKIEISPQERDNLVNNVRFEEVNKDNLISSYQSKQIFIPINSFKSICEKYEEEIKDKDKLFSDLENYEHISYDNLNQILTYFDESVNSDIVVDIQEMHDEISNNVFKTLDMLNKPNLSFEELNDLIDESDDLHQKEIFSNIKLIADDLVKNYIIEYIKEMESTPVTDFAENGRKLLRYKNYDIVEDKYGFSLKEIDENIFLDDDQTKAVEYDGDKPLVINAGPGSGKTRVIIERVVHLVKKGENPGSILIITFTRKATQELKERLINETDLDLKDVNKIRISTVHGFCRYLISKYEPVPYNYLTRHGEKSLFLKKHKHELGFTKYAFIYDHWIPTVLDKYNEYFSFNVDTENLVNCLERRMSNFESKNKNYKVHIDNFYKDHSIDENPDYENIKRRGYSGASYYYRWLNIAKSYPKFLELMEKSRTCDDNTVLVKANEILENEHILNQIQYKNILIDEFQDTDHYQKEIFEKLMKISKSFTVVGDVDQSIYGWRGAYPEYFEKFSKNADTIVLHNNYRSSRNIVEFNEELIKDTRTMEKELKAKKKYKTPIYQMVNSSVEDEATRIADLIDNLKRDGKIKYYSDVAVLFRKNNSVDSLIKPLEAKGIDYHLKENNDFLDQNEVRAMLTLFWYVMPYRKYELNHLGDDFLNLYGFTDEKYESSEFFRLSSQTMDLLKQTQHNFEETLKKQAKSIYSFKKRKLINFSYGDVFNVEDNIKKEIFDGITTFDLAELDKEGLIDFGIANEEDIEFFLKLRELKIKVLNKDLTTLKLFYELLNLTDYFSEISIENNPDDLKVKDNLALFSHIIKDYESIMGDRDFEGLFIYLSRVLKGYSCRQNEFDEGFNKVHLLSMHSAKGLEYPIVIVGSIKQGICPLNYGNNDEYYFTPNIYLKYKENDLKLDEDKYDDEELRTLYVASTRAKEILIFSTIGKDDEDVPKFLYELKFNPNTTIQLLEPYTLTNIPKIESSKVFKQKNDFPKVKFENLLDDFLYCEYRYDLANNTRFKVKLRNDKYADMVLHKLLNNMYDDGEISLGRLDAKISTILNYHNISDSHGAYDIINNVRDYWMEYGSKYDVLDNNINIFSQLQYCDLSSVIDLIIKEDGKLSIVHFIGSDENIHDIDEYMDMLLYYFILLKETDEFKDYEFGKIYLHSLKNNKRYEKLYDEELEEDIIELIDDFTRIIHDNSFERDNEYCEACEYYGSVCKG